MRAAMTLCAKTSAILIPLLGIGCASKQTPEQQFYTLRAMTSGEEAVQGSVGLENARLRIAGVSAAAYLSQPGIVIADAAGIIYPANFHLWADLPDVAIKRRLERCVLQDTKAERKPQEIQVQIHSFQGAGDGDVVFGGVWTSTTKDARASKDTYLFEYREGQQGDGYGPLVAALSKTVQQLCVDILEKAV